MRRYQEMLPSLRLWNAISGGFSNRPVPQALIRWHPGPSRLRSPRRSGVPARCYIVPGDVRLAPVGCLSLSTSLHSRLGAEPRHELRDVPDLGRDVINDDRLNTVAENLGPLIHHSPIVQCLANEGCISHPGLNAEN